ncbi:MAG: hypothetical protein JEZ05_11020 [Tenericutes bacterium]|nr:hypothetical protein [Mycoplasmatota bacterium]
MKILFQDLITEVKEIYNFKKTLLYIVLGVNLIRAGITKFWIFPKIFSNRYGEIDQNYSILYMLLIIISLFLNLYFRQYIVSNKDSIILSKKRFLKIFKEIPNMFMTALFALVRNLPYFFLAIGISIPFIILARHTNLK